MENIFVRKMLMKLATECAHTRDTSSAGDRSNVDYCKFTKPVANLVKLLLPFFAIKLGHFIVDTIFFVSYKLSSLTERMETRV